MDDVIDLYKYEFIPYDVKSVLGGNTNLGVQFNINSGDASKKENKHYERFI